MKEHKKSREGKNIQELQEYFIDHFYYHDRGLETGTFIDVLLVDHCNLQCAGCDHFSYMSEPWFIDLKSLKEQLEIIKENIPWLEAVSLWGGEPLLHPDIIEICKITRNIFPKQQITIGSNGILIQTLSENDLQVLQDLKIGFQISYYFSDEQNFNNITKILEEKKVHYCLTDSRSHFQMTQINPWGTEDVTQYYTCGKAPLPELTLKDYKLYKCAFSACIEKPSKKLNLNIPQEEGIDYLDIRKITKEKLYEFVFSPSKLCAYCTENYENNTIWHQWNSKIGNPLYSLKDFYLYNYKEYEKCKTNKKVFDILYNIPERFKVWDGNGMNYLKEKECQRYLNNNLSIVIAYGDDIVLKNVTDFLMHIKQDQLIIDKKCTFYLLSNASKYEEEIYDIFINEPLINSIFFKSDYKITMGELYNKFLPKIDGEFIIFLDFLDRPKKENILKYIDTIAQDCLKSIKTPNQYVFYKKDLYESKNSFLPINNFALDFLYNDFSKNKQDIFVVEDFFNFKQKKLTFNDIVIYLIYYYYNNKDLQWFIKQKFIFEDNNFLSEKEKELLIGLHFLLSSLIYKESKIKNFSFNQDDFYTQWILDKNEKKDYKIKINNHFTYTLRDLKEKIKVILIKESTHEMRKFLKEFNIL